MSLREFAGAAPTTALAAGISNSDTSFTVTSGGGTGYPTGATAPFIVCLDRDNAGEEKILCTRTGDTFTVVTRGYDDTVASSHSINAPVEHVGGAIDFREANAHINATSGAHAATAISNTPAGNIAATTVQAALNELDSEKLATTAAAELIRDTIGAALVAGSNITLTVNDGADTITIAAAGAAGVLASAYYDPGSPVTQTTASSTFAATDTTNLRATFTVPASGSVIVKFGGFLIAGNPSPGTTAYPSLGVLNGSTVVATVAGYNYPEFGYITGSKKITGLTPGASLSYDLALASGYPSATNMIMQYGGGLNTNGYGPAFVEVWAA